MGVLKYLRYGVLSIATAGALYLTHREAYNAGVERGNFAGQQETIKKC